MRINKNSCKYGWLSVSFVWIVSSFLSCSEDVYDPPEDDTVIEAELAYTRAEYPNAQDIKRFYMNGINNGTQSWSIRNYEYVKNASTGKWKAKKTFVWPKAPITLSFFVVNPSFDIFNQEQSVVAHDKVNMVYTVPDSAHKQTDILYGSMLNQDQNTNNKVVKFSFKHGLCYQRFKGQSQLGDRYEVTIKSITLCNVLTTGTMKYNMTTANKVAWAVDNTLPRKKTTIVFKDSYGNEGVKLKSTADYLSQTDYLMTLPQKNTLWTTTGAETGSISVADANSSNLHYWILEAKIHDLQYENEEDEYLLGNKDNTDTEKPEWGIVYMKSATKEWKMGNTYLNTVAITKSSLFNEAGKNFFDNLETSTGQEVVILGADNISTVITTEQWGYEEDESIDLEIDADYESSNN